MENLHITILKDVGGVGAAAVVTVYDAGTVDVSTIYSDDGSTAAGNPLTADAYGRTNFYAANGSYDIKVTGTGISEYTMSAVKLFDVKTVDEADTNADLDKAVSNNLAKGWETTKDSLGYYLKHTVTAGEETSGIITVTAYTTGNDSLHVFLNGSLQCITDDYAETNTTTITFVADRITEDDTLILRG